MPQKTKMMRWFCLGFFFVAQTMALVPVGVSIRKTRLLKSISADENEVKLAELIFSTRDPRLEVAMAPDAYDIDFCEYVTAKAEASTDVEERVALKSLVDLVKETKEKIEEAERDDALEVSHEVVQGGESDEDIEIKSNAQVLAAAQSMMAPGAAAAKTEKERKEAEERGRSEAGLSGAVLTTYEALLTRLIEAYEANRLDAEIEASYEQCDYSLLGLASGRAEGKQNEDSDEANACKAIVTAINEKAKEKLSLATERLQGVLRAGAPERMFQKVTELAARGAVDRVLIELLEANRQQAQAAGAADAANLMNSLANKCRDELDRNFDPPKKLLRALLRCDEESARDSLLRRAFEPKESIALGFDGAQTKGGCDVEPPDFIAACQTLIADFGNLELPNNEKKNSPDDDDAHLLLADKVRAIADQAETIAIELFGESLSPREQQDRAWSETTTSVFDLEAAEMAAETQGDRMPWQDDSYDDMLPPGFDQSTGVKRVGGN